MLSARPRILDVLEEPAECSQHGIHGDQPPRSCGMKRVSSTVASNSRSKLPGRPSFASATARKPFPRQVMKTLPSVLDRRCIGRIKGVPRVAAAIHNDLNVHWDCSNAGVRWPLNAASTLGFPISR